jgi:mono/diheme cytochrome c family protein
MLAWAMNGEILPVAHGFPLRLVVPGWIGVANVKWLTRLTASPVPLEGLYQTQNYMIYREGQPAVPATLQPVKSVIARPAGGSTVNAGPVLVSGFAWSGAGKIAAVDISSDGGQSWTAARLHEPIMARHWVRWSLPWQPAPGAYSLMSRATDETGSSQPASVEWNRLGYGYNAIESVQVTVAGAPAAAPPPAPADTSAGSGGSDAAPVTGSTVSLSGDAALGKAVYDRECARCHGADGQGTSGGPTLVGDGTAPRGLSKQQLFDYVRTSMPYDKPGSLSEAEYTQVVEYLRVVNGLQ